MKKPIQLSISVVLILGLFSCQMNSFSDADKEAITKTVTEAIQGLNDSKDIDAYVNAYYADNATMLMTSSEPIHGKDAIMTTLKSLGGVKFDIKITEISGNGDQAYVYGNYELELLANGMKDHGKYIEVWKKQADGNWRVMFDSPSSNVQVSNGIEGVYKYLPPLKGQSIVMNGHFDFLFGPSNGKGPMVSQAGTYTISGDTVKNTITQSTDPKQIGTVYWWRTKSVSGDTATYETMNDKGQITGGGRGLRVGM